MGLTLLLHILVLIPVFKSDKILLLPSASVSHCLEISGVGHGLLDRGHSVFILIGSTFNHRNCFDWGSNGNRRIEPIFSKDSPEVFSSADSLKQLNEAITADRDYSFGSQISLIKNLSLIPCSNMFYDKDVLQRISTEKFDLAIVDTTVFTYCYYLLPVKLEIPYVGISSHFEEFVSGSPFVPSILPSHILSYTDSMSFFERLANTISYIGVNLLSRFSQPMEALGKIDPELTRQDLIDLAAKCELFLHNYDFILSYPVPVMPNHVMIGGITAGPAKPLLPPLDTFYQTASKDIIVMTFGSCLGNMPPIVDEYLTRVFRKLDVNVVWHHETESDTGNIKRMKWVPQNDLLGHPKTKVFVSHCGNNGVFEALYHGVPLVCTPIFVDQFYNGIRIQKWGAGKMLPLLTSSEEEFYEAIHAVLTDPSYRRNMIRASQMYHSQPMTARERAAFWVEYVLKYGGAHLRSKASEMSTFVYMGYDIFCFIVGLLGLITIVVIKCILSICRRCQKKSEKVKVR